MTYTITEIRKGRFTEITYQLIENGTEVVFESQDENEVKSKMNFLNLLNN